MSNEQQNGVLYNQYSHKLADLDQGESIIAEYIWLDGTGIELRAKCRTLPKRVSTVKEIPDWNYDGSSCYQACTENSEIILKPAAIFKDPFRGGHNIMVYCECWQWKDGTFQELIPANTNFRTYANKIFDAAEVNNEATWYGIEQEYTLLGTETKFTTHPLGWPSNGYPGPQGPYYCSVGGNKNFGRIIADMHYKACLFAGVKIAGTNAEVMPGQWEYQVGPCLGVEIGDHMMVGRYLLQRVAEDFQVNVSFAPKLFPDWNGSGAHTNFSTLTMRNGNLGMPYIEQMMKRFEAKHKQHIEVYGSDNHKRLTGIHETSSCDVFSYGVGNRAASFRIPTSTAAANGKGYIEDRRPASNIDPYIVCALIADSAIKDESLAGEMLFHYKKWMQWRLTADIPSH